MHMLLNRLVEEKSRWAWGIWPSTVLIINGQSRIFLAFWNILVPIFRPKSSLQAKIFLFLREFDTVGGLLRGYPLREVVGCAKLI